MGGEADPLAAVFHAVLWQKDRAHVGMMKTNQPRAAAGRKNKGFAQHLARPLVPDPAAEDSDDPSEKGF